MPPQLIGSTLGLTESLYEDLRFPAQAINPAGAAAAPTVDTTLTGFPGTLLFSGSQQNVIVGIAQMPHGWRQETSIHPHIHWARTTTGSSGVQWDFYYRMAQGNNGAWTDWSSAVTVTDTEAPGTANETIITGFGPVVMTGYDISCLIAWRVDRRGNLDAESATVRLFEFDIHYEADTFGSDLVFSKTDT